MLAHGVNVAERQRGSALIQGRYFAEQRNRNRSTILTVTALLLALCVLGGLLVNRSVSDVAISAAVIVAFALVFWWLFGSRNAGPVRLSDSSVSYMQRVAWWDPANPWRWSKREGAAGSENADWPEDETGASSQKPTNQRTE